MLGIAVGLAHVMRELAIVFDAHTKLFGNPLLKRAFSRSARARM
jgi:hypothetical protein